MKLILYILKLNRVLETLLHLKTTYIAFKVSRLFFAYKTKALYKPFMSFLKPY